MYILKSQIYGFEIEINKKIDHHIMKLTNEDKDDLLKYARHFALKAAQIIVSSRQKEKKSTPCRQKSDWVNNHLILSSQILCYTLCVLV